MSESVGGTREGAAGAGPQISAEAVAAANEAFWKDGDGDWAASLLTALEAAAPHIMAALSVEDLLSTKAGLALANAAYGEGLSAGIRACNEAEGRVPFRKPESPYSAPLLRMKSK